jgi:signal transduction histidine kinase
MGMETDFLPKAGQPGLIIIIGVFLMFFMGTILLLFFYFSKKKIIQKELEKKELELDYQKDLLYATIEVQEEERKRIAQDLHDDISSKLNVISLNSHLLTTPNLTKKEVDDITCNIINLIAKTLDNSRQIAHDLLPPVLDKFGLHAGLEELCYEFNSSKSVAVNYQNSVVFNDADKNRHLHVFRIIQELMNNSLRHGNAKAVGINFTEDNQAITCTYTDNGKGFDVDSLKNKKGLGMKNIESRIIFLNGTIAISSVINKGTEVIFKF